MLGANRYGKSGIRMVKLVRHPDRHELKDLTVAIAFEGAFESVHTLGDNSAVLPTDTMKNTVYALAKQHSLEHIEAFGLALGVPGDHRALANHREMSGEGDHQHGPAGVEHHLLGQLLRRP